MLPCVDRTSTDIFEQGLFLTPQLEYGSGKRACLGVSLFSLLVYDDSNTPKRNGQHAVFPGVLDRALRSQPCFPRQPSGLSGKEKFVWNGYLSSHVHTGVSGWCIWHQALCIAQSLPSATMKINSSISKKSPTLHSAVQSCSSAFRCLLLWPCSSQWTHRLKTCWYFLLLCLCTSHYGARSDLETNLYSQVLP